MNAAADALGTALVHSLWQDAIVGLLLWSALLLLRHRTPQARYLACCAAMAAMVALPIATAALRYSRVVPTAAPDAAAPAAVTSAGSGAAAAIERPPAAARPGDRASWLAAVQAWSVPVWSMGALLFSLRLVPAAFYTRRLRRRSMPAENAISSDVSMLAARVGVRRPVSVRMSALTRSPATIGFLRPVILVPPATLLGVTPEGLQALLAHELAHIRRHDYLVNALQLAAETLLFHHPAVWWASRRMRTERELCCDDIAVQACGDPVVYARALSRVAEHGTAGPRLALGAADGSLLRRIQRILGVSTIARPVPPLWAGAAAAAMIPLVLAAVGAQSTRPGTIAPSRDGAGLRGRVVDARSGLPVAGATVRAQYVTGVERPTNCPIGDCEEVVDPVVGRIPVYRAATDADGRFEMEGVRPGEYIVAAAAPGYVQGYHGQASEDMPEVPVQVRQGEIADSVRVALHAAGSISGRILSETGEGLPGVEVELLRRTYLRGGAQPVAVAFAQTAEMGSFSFRNVAPGEYYVRAYSSGSRRPAGADTALSYVATYLPGVADPAFAQPVVVGSGEDLAGMDFELAAARTRVVSGRLFDPSGASTAGVTVHLFPRPSGPADMLRASAGADGAFRFDAVPQGDYMLVVSDATQGRSWNGAVRDVTVREDVTDLQLAAVASVRIEGRIATERGRASLDLTDLDISLDQRTSDLGTHGAGFAREVSADGRFTMQSGTGTMSLGITGLPRGWFVKSVRLDGTEVDDGAFEIAPGAERLEILLTDLAGDLSGRVSDGAGRALPNALVVAFPSDRARWNRPESIRQTFAYGGGRYEIRGLPLAQYRVVAVTTLPRNAWTDPDVLARLWPSGSSVWLDDAGRRTVNLEAVRPPADLMP